jgi:uracil permease
MNKLNLKNEMKDWVLSIQHLFAMFGATVLVPLLVGINPSIAILTAGLGTLVFHLCTKGKVPAFLGSSFAFISPIILVSTTYGFAYVQGSVIIVGLVYALMSFLVYKIGTERISKYLPPHVVGAMIIIIGLTLIPSAITNCQTHISIATVTLVTSLLITFFGKGFIKQLGILIGVVVGYLLSLWVGLVDTSIIANASLFSNPIVFTVPKFGLEAILIIVPLAICTILEHIGDITTNGTVVGKNFVKDPGLHRSILGDGLATALAGLLGSVPNTTYGENTSLLAITKNYNPKLLRRTAIIAIVLSFIGVVGATLQSVPASVIGGISLQLYCMISWIGVKNIKDNKSYMSVTKLIVIIVMLFIGLGSLIGVNLSIAIGSVTLSGLSLAGVVGIVLNAIITSVEKRVTSK